MLAPRVDDAARVCRLQSLWSEAASRPVNQSTLAMRNVLEGLCNELGATDGSWLVMRRHGVKQPKMSEGHFSGAVEEMQGWLPVVAMYLNPDKVLRRVLERWFVHARKSGIDPMSREVMRNVGLPRAYIRDDVATDEEWDGHWMARKFLHYYGVGERMVSVIPLAEDCECIMLLDRPLDGDRFTSADKQFFFMVVSGLRGLHRNLCIERGAIHATKPLSRRERETYCHLLTSMSEAEIAEQMGLSAHTVHDYARKLYRKFNVKGRVGLMALVHGS